MNLSQIELLRVLQETGLNLSKAAEKMHVVQSAVSRQLQLFEDELGSALFVRKGKKLIALTPLGQQIMAEVSRINQAKLNIHNIAQDYINSERGIIRIATTHTQAKYFLPQPIQRFREKYPSVRIYIVQASPEQLIVQLHEHKADIAVCTERVQDDHELVTQECYQWHHAAVMPNNHPLSEGDISYERLAQYPILTYSFGFTGRSNIESAFALAGFHLDIILAAADTDVIKTYVRLGMGVGIIAAMAYDALMDKDLVIRDLAHLIPKSTTKIAYLRQHYLPQYSRQFIQELLLAAGKSA